MKANIERKMILGMGIVLLLLATVGIWSYLSIQMLVKNSRQATDILNIRRNSRDILLAMVDMETGMRGFVITGNESYLEPFNSGIVRSSEAINRLTKLEMTAEQKERVERLSQLIISRTALAQRNVDIRRNEGFEAAANSVRGGDGKQEMDRLREVVSSIVGMQEKLLAEQNERGEQQGRNTSWIIAISGSFAFIFVAASCIMIHYDLRRRKEAEEQLSSFFSLSLDMLCIAGTDGYFKRVNPSWEKTLGFTGAELMAKPYLEFIHPDDVQTTIEAARTVASAGSISRFENRYLCKDGSYRWLVWSSVLAGNGQQHFASARDITDQKNAEAEIAALNKTLRLHNTQLEATNKELESFSYSVSHDLRAPLRSLDGFSQALLEDCADKLDNDGQEHLRRIRGASQRMGQLIDDLLNLSRFTRMQITRETVNLSQIAKEIVDELRASDPSRTVEVVIADGIVAEGDPRLVRVLLTNLLGNAWKFTSKRPEARIEFGCSGVNGEQAYFVRDNGVGFDMAYAGKLFGAFQRLHGMTEFPGTGIGLATVQRVIHKHGGRVWAESEIDAGATFYFTI